MGTHRFARFGIAAAAAFALAACGGAADLWPDGGENISDAGPDAGAPDAGAPDAGTPDAGAPDAGTPDAGTPDAAVTDAGETDAGPADAGVDGGSPDAGVPDAGGPDAGAPCAVSGAPGVCIEITACAAIRDHSSFAGHCPGPSSIECCIDTPDTSDNPPVPAGYRLLHQAEVTPAMTTWAVAILHDPVTYPMFATTTQTFGSLAVLARVEWHPPDFQNGVVHRGVTLYTHT